MTSTSAFTKTRFRPRSFMAGAAVLLVCLFGFAACSGASKGSSSAGDSPASATLASSHSGISDNNPPSGPLVSETANIPDGQGNGQSVVQMDVLSLQRSGHGQVTLRLRFKNVGSTNLSFGGKFGSGSDLSGVTLLDLAQNKEYVAGSDSNNNCVCTNFNNDMDPGLSTEGYVMFAAPPQSTSTVQVAVPNFTPVNVPVS